MTKQTIRLVFAAIRCVRGLCTWAFPQVLGDINGDGILNAGDASFNFTTQMDRRKIEFIDVLLTQGGQGMLAVMPISFISGSGTNSGE